jgi:hypothetical protein
MMLQGIHLTALGGGTVLLEPTEALDPGVPDAYVVPLAEALQQMRARRLLYDLKNQPVVDKLYFDWLRRLNAICRISGIEMVAVNIRPPTAYALSILLEEAPPFRCALDVDSARMPAAASN